MGKKINEYQQIKLKLEKKLFIRYWKNSQYDDEKIPMVKN